MKHFTNEEGIDFVNQVMPSEKQAEFQKHLDSGCKRCNDMIGTWRQVREAGASEAGYQPPEGAVRIAKAAFGAAGKLKSASGLKLLFDSLLQPAVAGYRSIGSDARQLLYAAGPYLLDLYISPNARKNRISLTGQLMNSKFPEKMHSEVTILISYGKGKTVLVKTDAFGEFRGEVENSGDLELRIPDPIGKDLVISLGCLFNGLIEGTQETGARGGI